MSKVAIKPQDFATAGNYSAGADAWSGQPRAVLMTASEKANGFTPNTPVAPESHNGNYQELFQGSSLLAYKGLQEWHQTLLPVTAGGRACSLPFLVAPAIPGQLQKSVFAIGWDTNASNHLAVCRSLGGGGFFESSVTVNPSHTGAYAAARGASGEALINNNVEGVDLTQFGGATAFNGSLGTAVSYYISWSATPFIAFSLAGGAGQFLKGTSFGSVSGATGPTITAGITNTLGTQGARFVDDGVGVVLLVARTTIASVDRFRIFKSADGGSTWTTVQTFGSAITSVDCTWSSYWGCFFAFASDGSMWTSPDGSSWTNVRTSVTLTETAGLSPRYHTLVSCGAAIVKAWQPTNFSTQMSGIVYSFDLGATWRATLLDDQGFADQIKSVLSVNGCVWVNCGGSRVLRSGLLEYENGIDY